MALALAVLIGDGCCAFVSLCLGRNEKEKAHQSIGNSVLLCILVSIVLTVIYLVFMDPILTMFGGRVNEETFYYAKEYFFYITLGVPFYMFGQAMNPIIRSDGSPGFAMVSTVAGAVTNLILDPVFIFGKPDFPEFPLLSQSLHFAEAHRNPAGFPGRFHRHRWERGAAPYPRIPVWRE